MTNQGCTDLGGLLVGGNANNSSNCGFAYMNANNRPTNTNANYGSHLYWSRLDEYDKMKRTAIWSGASPLGGKQSVAKRALVAGTKARARTNKDNF